ncbi:hypothetical protein [Achromobacter sp. UMC71]|uniref:hypothetical protein n=1 Tax=Achromobacter sp. UMC71 TaxID=1862320 RepID=UPI00351C56C6
MLSWLCACLLLAPLGGLRHLLTHLDTGAGSAPGNISAARVADASGPASDSSTAPASLPDDAHAADKLGHCDLCHIWDLLDATLPASFPFIAGAAPRIAPPPSTPVGATVAAGNWFQSRAPPAAA